MLSILKFRKIIGIYIFALLFSLHVALPSFINSSFLDTFLPENLVGLIYGSASVITIGLFIVAPFILKKFGNYRTCFFLILLEALALILLIINQNPYLAISSFVLSLVTIPFIYFSLDVFLEGMSDDQDTGKIRGIYLTLMNMVWVFAPWINGLILVNGDYWKIYLLSLSLLLPAFIILNLTLNKFQDSAYEAVSIWQTARSVWHNKNIKNIFTATFLLNFFYSWMTIYTPIYLHKYMGFSWIEIGIIFGAMLLPFVFFQYPLGRLADEKIGEKEILSLGFIFISFFTVAIFYLPVNSGLYLWAGLLFMTRIGASAVEVMVDTYFFKKVSSSNANIIGFFRIARPLAYMIGSASLSLVLYFIKPDSGLVFIILGFIMLSGLFFSLRLEDTK
jgi:MFS family permease